ncbi:non-canonical purine NTP pyrophosphatase [Candidatus Woesearchaeota archaeon]|nr:non-canonical purine NTP pyrophosphatase [Candidatus Woesearchaeota archaeon]
MKINFVTGNNHKFQEVKKIMQSFNLNQIKGKKIEPKDKSVEEIASLNAESFFKNLKKPVIVDDTGIFFNAYQNFPGNHPKLMYKMLGFKGLLKLLKDEKRDAYFKTVAAYADKEGVRLFEGKLRGKIARQVFGKEKDVMPYEKIFKHKGKYLCELSREKKNKISHRAIAFGKLRDWLLKK